MDGGFCMPVTWAPRPHADTYPDTTDRRVIPGLPGVRLWIWPRHRLSALGVTVELTRREGDVLAVLASDVRRYWHRDELADLAYSDPDDEPEFPADTIRTRIWRLRRKFRSHGLVLDIHGRRGSWGGYRLVGIHPVPRPLPDAVPFPFPPPPLPTHGAIRVAPGTRAPRPPDIAIGDAIRVARPIAAPGTRPPRLRLRGGGSPPARLPVPLRQDR